MTIDVKYGQLQAQTESAKSACQQLKNALPSLQHAIMQITMQNHLKGQAIQSAKQYVQQLAMPVLLAAEETIDYFETGIEKFTSEYFDKKDWCDEDLKEKIDQLKKQRTANKQMLTAMKKASTKGMSAKAKASRKDVMSSLSKANETLSDQIEKYEAILRKLEDYDEQSTQFLSEFSSLYQKVSTGIHQASISYDPGRQLFNLPSTNDLSWKQSFKSIHSQQTVIQQLNKKTLSQKEIANLMNTVILYPGLTIGMTTAQSKKLMMYTQLVYQNYDAIKGNLSEKAKHFFKVTCEKIKNDPYLSEAISSIKEDMISKGIDSIDETLNNSIKSLDDYQFSIQNYGMGLSQVKNLSKGMKAIGKSVGLASFGYGVYDDVKNEGKNYGQAIVHNGASLATSSMLTSSAATILEGIGIISSANPITLLLLGIGSTIFFEYNYSKNTVNIQKNLDELGNDLNNAGKKVKEDLPRVKYSLNKKQINKNKKIVYQYLKNTKIDKHIEEYNKYSNNYNKINGYS